jgi:hypothetical protein
MVIPSLAFECIYANMMSLVKGSDNEDGEEDNEDEDEDEEDEDEDETEDDEDDENDRNDGEPKALVSPSKRKKKQIDETASIDTVSIADSSTTDEDVSEADTAATSVDDGLPHPRVCPTIISFLTSRWLLTFSSLSNLDGSSSPGHRQSGKRS